MQVPIKGSFTWWQPDRIYVITNIYPANWYNFADRMVHYEALRRCFTQVIQFTQSKKLVIDPSSLQARPAWDQFWAYTQHHVERADFY